jgi:hypothetical protein
MIIEAKNSEKAVCIRLFVELQCGRNQPPPDMIQSLL